MVTAYDYSSGLLADKANIDMVLVGDSAAMVVLGHNSTVAITVDEMVMLTGAVRRGVTNALVVADLPFGSYERSNEQAVATAQQFMKQSGCDAVKLEGGGTSVERAKAIVAAGIPIVGHVGLTPQTVSALGGFRAQGKSAQAAFEILRAAEQLEQAGCFMVVLEAVPAAIAGDISRQLKIPTIGIGAGNGTDGQVLVWHDLLGIFADQPAKFVKRFAEIGTEIGSALKHYRDEVREQRFPTDEHTYKIDNEELKRFKELVK